EDAARDLREFALIVNRSGQAVEGFARLLFEEGAPGLDGDARALGRRIAGQPFADDEAEKLGGNEFAAFGNVVEAAGAAALRQIGGEVPAHARHRERAQRLDAALFRRVVDGAG